MKRNKFFMLGIVTVLVAVLSLTFVSNTFAKYTSTVTGSDTATVAKWAWEYDGGTLALNNNVTFDLLETRYDSNGSSAESDVKDGLIAPGTSGKFELSFTNKSEVTGQFTIEFESTETVEQIRYSLDGSSWVENIADLNEEAAITAKKVDMNATVSVTIYWEWRFEVDDATNGIDTTDGLATLVEHTVDADVIFEQVD